nr:SUMF1/EgtB/PvdO family nonheme iron enzyme [Victivallales bacterium]
MKNKGLSEEFVKILACPKDKSPVKQTESGDLKREECGKIYKVIDGIPVMLLDEETSSDEDGGKHPESMEKKEDVKFKPHPLLSRAKNRPKVVCKGESASADPFLLITEQNEKHKFRIVIRTVLVLMLMLLLFAAYLLYGSIMKKARSEKRINSIAMKISDCRKKIDSSEGYEKSKAAFSALCHIETLKNIDWKNEADWESRKDFFKKIIDAEATPYSGKTFITGFVPIDMVNIPQGVFAMGSTVQDRRSEEEEFPRRNVIINYEFWISRTEITNMQFKAAYPNHFIEDWAGERLDTLFQPAVMMDWHMAMSFCRFLNEKESEAGRVPKSYEYRLPTEAEWEYAARAGTTTIFFWGDAFDNEGAKFANTFDLKTSRIHKWKTEKGMASSDGYVVSAPVGSFKANAFGLFDTCGNVWEWCWDWYNPRAYKELALISPVQDKPVSSEIEMRGTFDRMYRIEGTSRVL